MLLSGRQHQVLRTRLVFTCLKCNDQPGGTRDQSLRLEFVGQMRVNVVNGWSDVSRKDQKCTAEQQESCCEHGTSLIVRGVSRLCHTRKNFKKNDKSP